jgi:anti-anti-sigma regulatory factor
METTAFPVLEPGEHACWLVRTVGEFADGAGQFLGHGARTGDKTLVIAAPCAASRAADQLSSVTFLDPRTPAGARDLVARTVRQEALRAGREGYRALRVLAQMETITPPGTGLDDLVEHELSLQDLTAGTATSVVCAYRQDLWDAPLLRGLTALHSWHVPADEHAAGFRMTPTGPGCWVLSGAVDYDETRSFAALLRAALARSRSLRLDCRGLELIDAAGLKVLTDAARVPGARIRVEGVTSTVARTWRLSGYGDAGLNMELLP